MPAIDGLAKLFEVKAGVNLRNLEISQYNQCTMAERVGFRTHGTVTRTTVFEFYDSRAGAYRLVAKRVLQFANFAVTVSACDL